MADRCETAERTYRDAEGRVCSLDVLCRREPAWAANRLRVADERIRTLEAELTETLALARNGWSSARLLAICPPTFGAPATERAADEALARLEAIGEKVAKEGGGG
jgi:hypothetical protein